MALTQGSTKAQSNRSASSSKSGGAPIVPEAHESEEYNIATWEPAVAAAKRRCAYIWMENSKEWSIDTLNSFSYAMKWVEPGTHSPWEPSHHPLWKQAVDEHTVDLDWGIWLVLRAIFYDIRRPAEPIRQKFAASECAQIIEKRYGGITDGIWTSERLKSPDAHAESPTCWKPLPAAARRPLVPQKRKSPGKTAGGGYVDKGTAMSCLPQAKKLPSAQSEDNKSANASESVLAKPQGERSEETSSSEPQQASGQDLSMQPSWKAIGGLLKERENKILQQLDAMHAAMLRLKAELTKISEVRQCIGHHPE